MNTQRIGLYKKTELETTDQISLILKLYDRAIQLLEKAKNDIAEKQYEGKNVSFTKAKDIVFELLTSLDEEKGGEIAASLSQLYNFVIREIMDANINLNRKAIDNSIHILSELRKSWSSLNSVPEIEYEEDDSASIALNVSV